MLSISEVPAYRKKEAGMPRKRIVTVIIEVNDPGAWRNKDVLPVVDFVVFDNGDFTTTKVGLLSIGQAVWQMAFALSLSPAYAGD